MYCFEGSLATLTSTSLEVSFIWNWYFCLINYSFLEECTLHAQQNCICSKIQIYFNYILIFLYKIKCLHTAILYILSISHSSQHLSPDLPSQAAPHLHTHLQPYYFPLNFHITWIQLLLHPLSHFTCFPSLFNVFFLLTWPVHEIRVEYRTLKIPREYLHVWENMWHVSLLTTLSTLFFSPFYFLVIACFIFL